MIRFSYRDRNDTRKQTSLTAGGVRTELEKVLASAAFSNSERSRRFLQFIVGEALEGRSDTIKESVIAVSVFGRNPLFDPRTDSTVRVEARNLRARLNEYYVTAGREDPVIIDVPKGTYVPVFRMARYEAPKPHAARWRLAPAAVVILAVAAAGAWLLFAPRPQWASVAVLPFSGPAGGPGGYIADGFVEDLIADLARVPDLKVAARNSSFRFRSPGTDVRSVGRQLDVAAVLRGSVRLQGGRLAVAAELVGTATGARIWSADFERDASEAQVVASEIRRAVATHLGLGGNRFPDRHQPSEEARAAYWQGRYAISARQDRQAAAKDYERAVQLDPEFADAWAALSITRAIMAFHWEGNGDASAGQARRAAGRAIELDPSTHEAYLALALLAYSFDHDWPASERAFRRVFEINPNWAYAHRSYALALTSRGAFDQAFFALDRAQRLDPLSVMATNEKAVVLLCSRRFEEAAAAARAHLKLSPRFVFARYIVGMALAGQERWDEAIEEFRQIAREHDRDSTLLGRLGNVLARSGRSAEARALIEEIDRGDRILPLAKVHLAMIHTGLGEKRRAMDLLWQAAAEHASDAVFLAVEPVFDPLRNEPGYRGLCTLLGLP